MKTAFTPIQYQNYNYCNIKYNTSPVITSHKLLNGNLSEDTVSFTGKPPVIKRPDVAGEINKLVKRIDELLNSPGNADLDERIQEAYDKVLKHRQYMEMKLEQLEVEMQAHLDRTDKYSKEYIQKSEILLQKYNELKKQDKFEVVVPRPTEEEIKMDYKLLNLFKTSIMNEHYDLQKIFDKYYAGLNNVHTVAELKEKYPKLIPSEKPENVIADKIIKVLTRDYFETMDSLVKNGNNDELAKHIYAPIEASHNEKFFRKYNINSDDYDSKLSETFYSKIMDKYDELEAKDSYNSVPIVRKVTNPQISEMDYKLMAVDYDDYILTIFKKMYINGQRFKDITYKNENIEFKLSEIKDNCYKIDKIQEKIKKFISEAAKITQHQRDYEKFNADELKERISYYSDRLENDEDLLGKMIDFITCRFHEEDKSMLIKFLKELDSIWDGKKTTSEAISSINHQNLRPVGTERLNEVERKAAVEKKRLDYKKFKELSVLQQRFDSAINILFQNNMNYMAECCAKYRPSTLEPHCIQKSNFVTNLINHYRISKNSETIENKRKLESKFNRWDIYNTYLKNAENTTLFESAKKFATKPDGSVDINEAGKYLINYEIIKDYPQTRQFYKNAEILDKIIELCADNKAEAIKYLCKYDSYTDLDANSKNHLTQYIDMFDIKNIMDKLILKNIIEKEYLKFNTVTTAQINESTPQMLDATITSNAKQDIYNHYLYPECLNLFKAFEESLGTRATIRGAAGVKKLFGEPYQFELKIMGYPDRLLAKDERLIFDTHSKQGLKH